jgi:hypothetical protein
MDTYFLRSACRRSTLLTVEDKRCIHDLNVVCSCPSCCYHWNNDVEARQSDEVNWPEPSTRKSASIMSPNKTKAMWFISHMAFYDYGLVLA